MKLFCVHDWELGEEVGDVYCIKCKKKAPSKTAMKVIMKRLKLTYTPIMIRECVYKPNPLLELLKKNKG